MWYSDSIIEEVLSRNDIVDIIGSYVKLKRSGASYLGLCPFHNERTPSFSVSPTGQYYHCFGCGVGGNAYNFLMEYENLTFTEAVEQLAERAGVTLPEKTDFEESRERESTRDRLLSLHKEAASFYFRLLRSPKGKEGANYLSGRKIGREAMRAFGLGFASIEGGLCDHLKSLGYNEQDILLSGLGKVDEKHGLRDRFWNRVIFPIMDVRNRVIAFGGRVMGDGEPKYLNSPETPIFEKGKNLYGLNLARKSRKGYFIACEGYMDVISLHEAGFSEAVASLGTAFTPDHAIVIKKYVSEVLLSYDSDTAGVKAALRAISILKAAGIRCRIIHMEPFKDPDEFIKSKGSDAYRDLIEKAEDSLSFEIHVMQKDYDLGRPDERTIFEEGLARRLSQIESELERANYTDSFAAEYMIKPDALHRLVEQYALMNSNKSDGMDFKSTRRTEDVSQSRNKNKDKDKGEFLAQKLLLSEIVKTPRIYDSIKQYLKPYEFSEGILRRIAEILFSQLESGKYAPAEIISKFRTSEEERLVAEIFSKGFDGELSGNEREKAITDLVIRVKRDGLMRQSREAEDPIGRILSEKKALEDLSRIKISLGVKSP